MLSGKRTNTMQFQAVDYRRYDELVGNRLYYALTDLLDEVYASLEAEYGVEAKMGAADALSYDEFSSYVLPDLEEVLYRMGLTVKKDWSASWRDDYDEKVSNGIWNNPDSVALFEEKWDVYDSLEEMPPQPFTALQSNPNAPANTYEPILDVRYWEGCPWHKDPNESRGSLFKAAIDEQMELPLFMDVGYFEVYASGSWCWDESRTTLGGVPVIAFRDDWMMLDEIRYMGEVVDCPGRIFYHGWDGNGNTVSAFSQMRTALGTFFKACEVAGVPPYGDDETAFQRWSQGPFVNIDDAEYRKCLDDAYELAERYE